MRALPDLTHRRLQPELMDDPGLDEAPHLQALGALRTVNRLSGTAARLWREIQAPPPAPGRPLRVLDLACGGGDVALALGLRARRAGLPVEIHGCDRSPVAVAHARSRAAAAGVDVSFSVLEVGRDALPEGYDLICATLFLHHLAEDGAVALLAAMAAAAPRLVVEDLRRTRLGYLLALLTLNTVARSDVARVDGLRSVAGAFTLEEARGLARRAGLQGARVRPCWPQRFSLTWRR